MSCAAATAQGRIRVGSTIFVAQRQMYEDLRAICARLPNSGIYRLPSAVLLQRHHVCTALAASKLSLQWPQAPWEYDAAKDVQGCNYRERWGKQRSAAHPPEAACVAACSEEALPRRLPGSRMSLWLNTRYTVFCNSSRSAARMGYGFASLRAHATAVGVGRGWDAAAARWRVSRSAVAGAWAYGAQNNGGLSLSLRPHVK
jgi:hypothetical protein